MNQNISQVKLDPLSYYSIPLKIFSCQKILASCTGFFYKLDNRYYLITNWHNFTAKNPITKESLNGNFVLPMYVEIPFLKTKQPTISWERHKFKIIDDNTQPMWFVHPNWDCRKF